MLNYNLQSSGGAAKQKKPDSSEAGKSGKTRSTLLHDCFSLSSYVNISSLRLVAVTTLYVLFIRKIPEIIGNLYTRYQLINSNSYSLQEKFTYLTLCLEYFLMTSPSPS